MLCADIYLAAGCTRSFVGVNGGDPFTGRLPCSSYNTYLGRPRGIGFIII
jgi:hypothetical protein